MAKTKKHKAEYDYISEYLLPLQKEGLIIMPRVIGDARILFNTTEQVGGKPVGCTIDMESDEYSLTFSTLTYQIGITKDDVWVKMCIYSPAICGCHLDVLRNKINEALADLKKAFSKKKSD